MRRIHLLEWEDQPWLPAVFRDFITDHLRYTQSEPMRAPIKRAIAERLRRVMEQSGCHRIVDLCAGAGGPIVEIHQILSKEPALPVEVVVTDLYPNVTAFRELESASSGSIRARFESTSAFDVPPELHGVRTMFTALHHFRPDDVRRLLGDAVRKGSPVAVFEPLERSVRMVTLVGLVSLLRGFSHTPRVGRMTRARFFFTYVCPLAPVMLAWDGAVSALRTYTPAELLEMSASVTAGGYRWEAGRFDVDGPYGSMPTTYLLGWPVGEKNNEGGRDTLPPSSC